MTSEFSKEVVLEGKIYALLSYLSILCIIPLIIKKNNGFVLVHGKQGLVLFVIQVAVWIMSIVMPFILAPCMFFLMILSFIGLLAVLRGELIKLPFISIWAQKISL